ncbi:MAG TPA: hypothetical protein VFK43_05190 [Acidimicrobiales bacterium]|nr:hypothetical protein [Acidimicrobiales bacterium]
MTGGKGLDPEGKRALFEAPVAADRRQVLSPGAAPEGKDALFSTGPARPGTVVVDCGSCGVRTRVGLLDVGVRLATLSVWLPARRRGHWMRCPSCDHRTWCRIGWSE